MSFQVEVVAITHPLVDDFQGLLKDLLSSCWLQSFRAGVPTRWQLVTTSAAKTPLKELAVTKYVLSKKASLSPTVMRHENKNLKPRRPNLHLKKKKKKVQVENGLSNFLQKSLHARKKPPSKSRILF